MVRQGKVHPREKNTRRLELCTTPVHVLHRGFSTHHQKVSNVRIFISAKVVSLTQGRLVVRHRGNIDWSDRCFCTGPMVSARFFQRFSRLLSRSLTRSRRCFPRAACTVPSRQKLCHLFVVYPSLERVARLAHGVNGSISWNSTHQFFSASLCPFRFKNSLVPSFAKLPDNVSGLFRTHKGVDSVFPLRLSL